MNTRSHISCISLGIVVLGLMFGSSNHFGCGAEKSSSGSAENGEGSPHLPSAQTTTSMQETPRIQTPVDLDPARSNTLDETFKIFPTPDGFFNDHRGRLDGTFDSKGLALSIGKTGEYNIGLETESVGCERGMEKYAASSSNDSGWVVFLAMVGVVRRWQKRVAQDEQKDGAR